MSKKFLQTLSLSTLLFYGVAGDINAAVQGKENACQVLAKCGESCKDKNLRDICLATCKGINWDLCVIEATAYYTKKDATTAGKKAEDLAHLIWKNVENDSNYCTTHQDACDFTS